MKVKTIDLSALWDAIGAVRRLSDPQRAKKPLVLKKGFTWGLGRNRDMITEIGKAADDMRKPPKWMMERDGKINKFGP